MHPWAIRLGTAALIAVAAALVYALARHAARANPPEVVNPANAAGWRDYPNWMGVGSCASSACHNGNYNQGNKDEVYAKQCEYSVWVLKDPHQKAYAVLLGDISRNIERNYRRLPPGSEVHAERDEVCLRCHVDPSIAKGPPSAAETPVWFQDGVGCESCHGPAKNWLADHVSIDWKQRDRASQTKTGFKYTKSLRVTAETCLECHVGSRRCESGHDLLAAGHPRLNFDFSLAMAHYP